MDALRIWLDGAGKTVTLTDKQSVSGMIPEDKMPVGTDCIVVSSAIQTSHLQYIWACANTVPVIHRSECVKQFMQRDGTQVVSISGAHGKTTTSSLLANILSLAGPTTFMVGGLVKNYSATARYVANAKYVCIEADESDGSMLNLGGDINLLTNLALEHINYYRSFDNYVTQMRNFLLLAKNRIAHSSCKGYLGAIKDVTYYGVDYDSKVINLQTSKNGMEFTLITSNDAYSIRTKLIGHHMIENIAGCVKICESLGLDKQIILDGIAEFKGTKKRSEIFESNGVLFIQDYAHHPNEIATTLESFKNISTGRVCVLWEPHKYSRLEVNGLDRFVKALEQADEVWILPVWGAGEDFVEKYSQENLVLKLPNSFQVAGAEDVRRRLQNMVPGDVVIAMGAGGIYKLFEEALQLCGAV